MAYILSTCHICPRCFITEADMTSLRGYWSRREEAEERKVLFFQEGVY